MDLEPVWVQVPAQRCRAVGGDPVPLSRNAVGGSVTVGMRALDELTVDGDTDRATSGDVIFASSGDGLGSSIGLEKEESRCGGWGI